MNTTPGIEEEKKKKKTEREEGWKDILRACVSWTPRDKNTKKKGTSKFWINLETRIR